MTTVGEILLDQDDAMSGMRITHGKMRYVYQTLGGELKKTQRCRGHSTARTCHWCASRKQPVQYIRVGDMHPRLT